jgi:vacuolar-type H+-ATPase subunit I/STV1
MSQANVRSLDALRDLRAALAVFADEILAALGGVDMEIRRTTRWLEEEQRLYWETEIKRRRERVSMARSDLSRKRMSQLNGSRDIEQKEALEEAERRLREAEARAQKVKRWVPILQQAVLEYRSTTRTLTDLVSGDLPRGLAQLDRVLDRLEAYLQVAAPSDYAAARAAGLDPFAAGGFASTTSAGATEPAASSEAPENPVDAEPPPADPPAAAENPTVQTAASTHEPPSHG